MGEAIDSWQKFLDLHEAVITWSEEKNEFVAQPLDFATLALAKQKLQDYSGAMKTVKYASKNVQEMSREHAKIAQVASTGHLGEKLDEAEKRKGDTETHLSEKASAGDQTTGFSLITVRSPLQNAMLQEMTEEWEQCERKIKESHDWINKSKDALESLQNKRLPIRDQLALRDRISGEVPSQRSKVIMSLEKLQVHFKEGSASEKDVHLMAKEVQQKLEELLSNIKKQNSTLEACLTQLDQYQQVRQTEGYPSNNQSKVCCI